MKKLTDKIRFVVLVGCLCVSLTGCASFDHKKGTELYAAGEYEKAQDIFEKLGDFGNSADWLKACNYMLAKEAFDAEDFETALSIYMDLGEYGDSEAKAAVCEREIGMRTNADYDFLSALEDSVCGRMEATLKSNADKSVLVNTELAYLEKFSSQTFYDHELCVIAQNYLEGLRLQKNSLKNKSDSGAELEWQQGMVSRYGALKKLHENYGFLADNQEFIGIYIMGCQEEMDKFLAYQAVGKDIYQQLTYEKVHGRTYGNAFHCTLKNNTKYTFGANFHITYLDTKDSMFESTYSYAGGITPGADYELTFYISKPSRLHRFLLDYYIDDIH